MMIAQMHSPHPRHPPGVGLGDGDGVWVGVCVRRGRSRGVAVASAVGVGVGVGVSLGVGVGRGVGVGVGRGVGVGVGRGVGVGVGDGDGVADGARVSGGCVGTRSTPHRVPSQRRLWTISNRHASQPWPPGTVSLFEAVQPRLDSSPMKWRLSAMNSVSTSPTPT
jgi:hypothetical protein